MKIRKAKLSDKPGIIEVAKQSKYTKGVSNPMFMPDTAFPKGEVAVAIHKDKVIGFTAIHNLVRKPYTSLYYVGVDEKYRSKKVGEQLVKWVMDQSPHSYIRLICEVENERAHKFYERLGFSFTGEGSNKAGEPYYIYECSASELILSYQS